MRSFVAANALTIVAATGRLRTDATPVEKVIELLGNLKSDTEVQGKKEAAQWKEYKDFCHRQDSEKKYMIAKSTKKIVKLSAKIDLLGAEIGELTESIAQLDKEIKSLGAEISAETESRAVEHAAYKQAVEDISQAISSVTAAIAAMKESKTSTTGAKVDLAQIRHVLSTTAQVALMVQLSQKPAGYEYQSNDIIATLENLKDTFLQKKKKTDEEEFAIQAAHDSKDLNRRNQRKFKLKEQSEKQGVVDKKTKEKGTSESTRVEDEEDKTMDEQYLDELTRTCAEKKKLWEQRSSTRDDELQAMSEALEMLKEKVKPAHKANKYLAQTQEAKQPQSFLQVQKNGASTSVKKAVTLLSKAARTIKSSPLALLAAKAAEAEDHFVKVRGLINDLVDKLESDAANEADQKSFCDEAMQQSISDRDQAQTEVEAASAEKARDLAEQKELTKSIADLSASIASLTKSLAEQTKLRQAEKEENANTIALATEGQDGVKFAQKVLSEFYNNALVQTSWTPPNAGRDNLTVADKDPEIFSSEYHGQQKQSKGIIAILEVMQSDFARTISETELQETEAEGEFKLVEADITSEVADKNTLKQSKSDRLLEVSDEITTGENTLAEQSEILKAVKDKFAALHPLCVEGEETYAERVAKREKEIEALKNALTVLENWQA